jgi:hypothetical protein
MVYKTNLELVNIDIVSANTVSSFFASIGDAQSNVYVGIGAGIAHSNMVSSSNSNTTFLGPGAGNTTSNVRDSIFIGYNSGQNSRGSSNNIAIGGNADGDGSNNIYIGKNTGVSNSDGLNNIFIGHGISPISLSNQFLVGPLVRPPGYIGDTLGSNYLLGGNLSSNYLGINLSNPAYTLDVNGFARIGTNQVGGLGINTIPGYFSLDVNGDMRVSDGAGVMTFTSDSNSNSVTTIIPVLPDKTARLGINISNPVNTLDVDGSTRIGTNQFGSLGINTVPGIFGLDVGGTMRVSDGAGVMTFIPDSNANSVTTILPVDSNKTATLRVNDGFFSVSGTTGSMVSGSFSNIGLWKKGIVMVSAQDVAGTGAFTSYLVIVRTFTGSIISTAMSSNIGGSVFINTGSASNIILTNNSGGTRSFTYSITYFPSP